MLSGFLKWGSRRQDPAGEGGNAPAPREEPIVTSKALPKFLGLLAQKASPVLLDFGPAIGSNIEFYGERLQCKLFIEDVFADIDRHVRGTGADDLAASFETRFRHPDGSVDGILCWDLFDFLDKDAGHALARQIMRLLKPGGAVVGFFGAAAVDRAAFTKYEIIDDTTLRHRYHPGVGGRKRSLQNRDAIRMFDGLIVADSFLLKSNTREMLLRKKADAGA